MGKEGEGRGGEGRAERMRTGLTGADQKQRPGEWATETEDRT